MPKRYSVTDEKLTLTLEEAVEGGYILTSPMDPQLITEAESVYRAFLSDRDRKTRCVAALPPPA